LSKPKNSIETQKKCGSAAETYRFAVSELDDCAAVAAAMRAKHVTAVPAVVLADQEGEVCVAALAPENGFVLHPAWPALVLHCDRNVKAAFGRTKLK
jgi:hypothetical protein